MDLPELIGGKYRPCGVLGTGATGTVYRVEHAFTGDLLALKVMNAQLSASPDAIARFKREARTASKIRSRHVVRVFDADVAPELGGVPYMVMDLLEGSDLEKLSHERIIAPDDVVEWLWQVASALDKAHRLGIVHRDLKPENLFLTTHDDDPPVVKILDFGIAKIETESAGITQLGQVFGTPLYMAPEQARGEPSQISPATDLFALGQIAYRLLAGTAYRSDAPFPQVLNQILNECIEPPSQRGHSFGDEFDRWFLRACHADPAQRFTSAREQIEALAQALGVAIDPKPVSGPTGSIPVTSRDSLPYGTLAIQAAGGGRVSTNPSASYPRTSNAAVVPGTPTLPGVGNDEPGPRDAGRPDSRRLAFATSALLLGMALVVFAFAREGAPPSPTAGAAVETLESPGARPAQPPVATLGPVAAAQAGQAVQGTPTGAAAIAATISASSADVGRSPSSITRSILSERPVMRMSVTRAAPPPTALPTPVRKNTVDDDPLSDQK